MRSVLGSILHSLYILGIRNYLGYSLVLIASLDSQ